MLCKNVVNAVNDTLYLLIPNPRVIYTDFEVDKPFALKILKPVKTKFYYFNNVRDLNKSKYVPVTKIFKENNIPVDSNVVYELINVKRQNQNGTN